MTLIFISRIFFILLLPLLLISCQKEIDGLINGTVSPANQKPKLGTVWTYNYSVWFSYGGLQYSKTITHKAKSEETLGGEKWLNIVNMETDTTVYYLNTKTGGLFQFANNGSNLFCKYPALLNETYTSFNDGSSEDFMVKGVNDSIATGIGTVPVNYYEGVKVGDIIDLIWYNDDAWILWRTVYRKRPPPSGQYYRYSTMFISSIVY